MCIRDSNCLEEYEAIKESFQDVDFKIVKRDGRHRFGKPYVYFDDIMEYFSGCDYDICGIINSDIHLLGVDNKFNEYIYEEARDSFVYGNRVCLLYTSPSPRDRTRSRMPSSA